MLPTKENTVNITVRHHWHTSYVGKAVKTWKFISGRRLEATHLACPSQQEKRGGPRLGAQGQRVRVPADPKQRAVDRGRGWLAWYESKTGAQEPPSSLPIRGRSKPPPGHGPTTTPERTRAHTHAHMCTKHSDHSLIHSHPPTNDTQRHKDTCTHIDPWFYARYTHFCLHVEEKLICSNLSY